MYRRARESCAILALAALMLGITACSSTVTPASSSGNAPVYSAWTTPPEPGTTYAAQPAQAAALQPAPRAVGTPMSAQPLPQVQPAGQMPPPPPPPDSSMPVVGAPSGAMAATTPAASSAPCAPMPTETTRMVVPDRTYSGCWLPCNDGISMWHARALAGIATSAGTDSFSNCVYYGLDLGRTFCGCWGLDAYYRYNSGRFDRNPGPGQAFKDGGEWHHFGAKVTFGKSFGHSPFYAWAGLGAGYFTTNNYIADDSGFELFGEAGVGYNLTRNWALRAGVNIHGMDTTVTRELPANDGKSRWLWIIAPVIEIEGRF